MQAIETNSVPVITRHKLETRRRVLEVKKIFRLTPNMIRVILEGDELADFVSLGADDHIKLFFPSDSEKPLMRDYTPRAYDTSACTLTLDFAIHDAGPATEWALEAKAGDTLQIGGPRGSSVISSNFDSWVLIGDETALPAIGRRVEEFPAGTQVTTIVAVTDTQDEQRFDTQADVKSYWVHRPEPDAANPAALLEAVATINLPQGKTFVWIAAEAMVARALRDHFVKTLNHPLEHLKAAGYWVRGEADASEKSLS